MARDDTRHDNPSHTTSTRKGEEQAHVGHEREPGREDKTAKARSSTSINPKSRAPIDPRMPHLPPA